MGILAYHVIITNYGFWLPNDPRGSWSDFVRSWDLFLAGGAATKTDTRASVAGNAHDHRRRAFTKQSLVRPPVLWTGQQAKTVGDGVARFITKAPFEIYACSILPSHTHLVISRPAYSVEQAANLLKGAATRALSRTGLHPFADAAYRNDRVPTPWARKQWACFLNNENAIRRAIAYVENNPIKDGKPAQRWQFIRPV